MCDNHSKKALIVNSFMVIRSSYPKANPSVMDGWETLSLAMDWNYYQPHSFG